MSEVTLIEPNKSSSSFAADLVSLVLFDGSILFKKELPVNSESNAAILS